jgi:hypothetical protein
LFLLKKDYKTLQPRSSLDSKIDGSIKKLFDRTEKKLFLKLFLPQLLINPPSYIETLSEMTKPKPAK